MAEQDIVERLRNGKPELYQAVAELRKWADWYVSCACGNVPDEAAAAYLLIEEFNRIDVALTEERSAYIMAHGIFQTEALRSKNEIDKLTAENASLRQQLAEARPIWLANCRNCGRVVDTRETHEGGDTFGAALSGGEWACSSECWHEIVDGALPHPDREGERLSQTETAARIVDTQAQYYAGHNEDIAKALREAAGAIRAQSQPRPGREGERE